jgi:23S rRNA (pseudouridine1915-N3)-methyltransferase
MKIVLIQIGKTDNSYLVTGIDHYNSLTSKMVNYDTLTIADLKNRRSISQADQKMQEGEKILKIIKPGDFLILLDERGEQFNSIGFSEMVNTIMIGGVKRIIFVIGGPFGFSEEVYSAAKRKVSLSRMTFSHQLVRLLFAEQLFRAFTLIKGIPYHNE